MKTVRTKRCRKLDPAILNNIVSRVAGLARPDRIILFGSAARGKMGPNSDVDLLVIKSGRFNRGRLTEKIYMGLGGLGEPVDIILVTSEEVERYGECPWLVIYPALKEGKLVYASKAPAGRRSARVVTART